MAGFSQARLLFHTSFVLSALSCSAAVFNIDPSRSSISLSGKVLGYAIQEQRSGSLTTKFEGTINADVTEVSVAFTGSSIISGQNSGTWEPKAKGEPGSDLANFGAKASAGFLGSALAAVRNSQLDLTSPALTIANGQFNSGSLLFAFLPNSTAALDYSLSGLLPQKGSLALAGLATNRVTAQATLTTSGDTQTLTIPLTADFYFKLLSANDTTLTLTGQIVATRSLGASGSSFDSWVASKFPGVVDPNIIGPGADSDQDGIPNFVEFAFGLNPKTLDPAFAPLKATPGPISSGQAVLEFSRPKGLASVNYQLLVSEDLATWTALTVAPEITDLGGGQEKVVVRDNLPLGAKHGRFVLLAVSKN